MDSDNLITQRMNESYYFSNPLKTCWQNWQSTEDYRPILKGERYLTDKEVSERLAELSCFTELSG